MANRDPYWMSLALQLAAHGRGFVEPNPMVGCVVVENDELLTSGYHHYFGGPHAEVDTLSKCDPNRLSNSTVYVTLEPCSHFGKTPPCVDLLLHHRPKRVVVAMQDPFGEVSGRGIQALRHQNIEVEVGVLQDRAQELNAPYLKLIATGMPWVVAKWAMTLDGAIATRDQDSKWISNELSRGVVHQLRSVMDAVIIGIGTAIADDPLLTTRLPDGARPARIATRVVVDRECRLLPTSKLVSSIAEGPVLVACSEKAEPERARILRSAGCEVLIIPEPELRSSLDFVLKELGRRRFTNVLLEGGGTLLGHAFDRGHIDQVHCFVAAKLAGGAKATRPLAGVGKSLMKEADELYNTTIETLGDNVHIQGMVRQITAQD
jgi:diaminohydroxyphosphoribosylaminopyrimidine deaminase / 5-amino-6-(5-phosphoribosylamino)uracil reductase